MLPYLRTLSPKEDLSLKEVTFKLTIFMVLVCATRADTLYKLDLQFRVYKHDGMSFTVSQLTKTSNTKKAFIEVVLPSISTRLKTLPSNLPENIMKVSRRSFIQGYLIMSQTLHFCLYSHHINQLHPQLYLDG